MIKTDRKRGIVFRILNRYAEAEISASATDYLSEKYSEIAEEKGVLSATILTSLEFLVILSSLLKEYLIWSMIMFRNYLTVAFRNITRQKLFSLVNIFGLAIGIASCMIIFLWVSDELSYDNFHSNADNIYRVERDVTSENNGGRWPITSGTYGPALVSDYPDILNYTRLWRRELTFTDFRNSYHRLPLFAADNSLLEIFDFTLDKGDPASALTRPNTMVLTAEKAKLLCGDANAVGKTVAVDWGGEVLELEITGILRELPENSHIHFDILVSIPTYSPNIFSRWGGNFVYTYVLLSETASVTELESGFTDFIKKYLSPVYAEAFDFDFDISERMQLKLQPVTEIHLNPSPQWEVQPQGSLETVYIFASVAVLILIIACINFMNLSTARASKRAKEVGVRKSIGAINNQLWKQFLSESVCLALLSLIIAVIIMFITLPFFNELSGKSFSFDSVFELQNLTVLILLTIATGMLAGIYPAFYLTAFSPVQVLKGRLSKGSGKSAIRKGMVFFQFIISTSLIITTLVVYKQMSFIQNRELGFDKENLITIPTMNRRIADNLEAFREELMRNPGIGGTAFSGRLPGDLYYGDTVFERNDTEDQENLTYIFTGFDFIDLYDMEIIAGRDFSRDFGTDSTGAFILNESAVRRYGLTPEEAIGKELRDLSGMNDDKFHTITGVVKDFHFKSMHREIEGLVIWLSPYIKRNLSIRLLPGDIPSTLSFIEESWNNMFPGEQFEFRFIDARLNELYHREIKMKNIFFVFSSLSIFVACLGLFGLAAFTAEERTKEIGIRKAIGASSAGVVIMLSKEFTRWVIFANLIAWPVSWYFMDKWLQSFAYRTDMGWLVFALSGVVALVFALLTVSWQAIKAARANPVVSLRYE